MAGSLRAYGGAIAFVTGAGSGIGEALAHEFAARGATVVVADRRIEEAARVAADIEAADGHAEALGLDVRSAPDFDAAIARTFARHGRLDFLLNNAGIGVAGEVKDLTVEDFRDILDVNVMGVVHGVLASYRRMIAQGFGHIVNTASMSGLMPTPLAAAYGLTKFAVVGFSRSLRVEAAHYGVRVTALCPGVVRTPILRGGAFGRYSRRPDDEAIDRAFRALWPMEPGEFAEDVLNALPGNPNTLIVPKRWLAVDLLNRISPELASRASGLSFEAMKEAYDAGVARRPPDGPKDRTKLG